MIRRFADPAALAAGAADHIASLLATALAERGVATIALAGGSTPRLLHRELASRPLDWLRVHVYFGDERCVPPDDPASNYRMARETLLDHVPAVVHRIEAELGAAAAATYQVPLPLDVVILGMGDDGHTASIFPGTPDSDEVVVATTSPVAPHPRISLTLSAIRRCRDVLLLVAGAGKAARLADLYAELAEGRPTLPAAQIGPATWMIDEAAAALLPRSDA